MSTSATQGGHNKREDYQKCSVLCCAPQLWVETYQCWICKLATTDDYILLYTLLSKLLNPCKWITMSSVLWHCWLGVRKSMRPVKIDWWGADVVICLERGANDMHMVQLMPLPPHHFLLYWNLDWFNISGAGLPRLSRKRGCYMGMCLSNWVRSHSSTNAAVLFHFVVTWWFLPVTCVLLLHTVITVYIHVMSAIV